MALLSTASSSHCSCFFPKSSLWGPRTGAKADSLRHLPHSPVVHRAYGPAQSAGGNLRGLSVDRQPSSSTRTVEPLLGQSAASRLPGAGAAVKHRRMVIHASAFAHKSSRGQEAGDQERGALTVSNVCLSLAPVDDLIPVERRLPAPKEVGVYALVPAGLTQPVVSNENPFGLQRMSQDDAMGFALGAATGKRTGPIDGPGWTLLDPGAASGVNSFAPAGPLISSSPRRTLRVEFTCNKCWERTTRAINPQAYKTGTVFVQCKGCNVYHKLIDNLKLFHELKGPIYSPPGPLFHTPYDPFNAGKPGGFGGLPFV